MKRIFSILMIVTVIFMCSCNSSVKYDPYELEKYDGYKVVGVMHDKVNHSDKYIFNVINDYESKMIEVSKKTFETYHIGDTIHCVRIVEEPVKNDSITSKDQDSIYILEKIGNHVYVFSKYGGVCHYDDCEYCNGF